MNDVLIYTAWSIAGVVVAYFALRFFWRAKSSYRVWKRRSATIVRRPPPAVA